ncbi:MAG TPA: L,D-transpeptidase family protein [Patescibacteria group bacterium]|nr:L,D-transpeptidase family protein [Patescibacteria group bacterium]
MTTTSQKTSLFLAATAALALLCAATASPAAQATPKAKHAKSSSAAAPGKPATSAAVTKAEVGTDEKPLPTQDTDEDLPLPPYPPGARTGTGQMKTYSIGEEDTFLDIARNFGLGYVELRAANPEIDPWSPLPGEKLVIPGFKLLPRAPQNGIVVNVGEMRMYFFRGAGLPPLSFPLGIGREGLETPVGSTTVTGKLAAPSWRPTARMRKEHAWMPAVVPPGAANPLGTHALYLGFPEVRIHGSNKPWGIGRRVSSGCLRMYPEDIVNVFNMTPVGTRVTVVNQPIKFAWVGDNMYLEANPSMTQSGQIEIDGTHSIKPMGDGLKEQIRAAAGEYEHRIDWSAVNSAIRERRGYPVLIATNGKARAPEVKNEKGKKAEPAKYDRRWKSEYN